MAYKDECRYAREGLNRALHAESPDRAEVAKAIDRVIFTEVDDPELAQYTVIRLPSRIERALYPNG